MGGFLRWGVVCLSVLISIVAIPAAWAEGAAKGARAVFPSLQYDFGTVIQGTVVKYDFSVRNEGAADLVIQRLVPSCGCTAVSSSNEAVQPGREGKIHVEFDTSGFSGPKLKLIRVYTNDFDNPVQQLTIKGVIEAEVDVQPRSLFFGDLVRGTPFEQHAKMVSVKVRSGSKLKISGLQVFSKYLLLKELETSHSQRKFLLGIDAAAPLGELRERVVINLSGGRGGDINVPVFASLKGQLVLMPAQLSFGVLEGKRELVRSVKFDNLGPTVVNIKDVSSNHPAVKALYKVIEPGKKYVIEVHVDPEKAPDTLKAVVSIETDSQEEKTVSLSVYGIKPPKL